MNEIIKASGIGKKFGATQALKDISFEVNEGEVFGFIGPDGGGKTTLFRIITTLLLPDEGDLNVLGFDCRKGFRELRKNIGYMPGRFSLYHDLTVEENLNFYATVFGTTVSVNYDLIADIYSHIEPFRKRLAGKLSGGMKQKLALSCALIHKPPLLVLDEPTTGVDAVSRSEFWEMLRKLRQHNITIIVSTPYMDEANKCDRIALMQKGKIMETDYLDNIIKRFPRKLFAVKSDGMFVLLNELREYQFSNSVFSFGDSLHYSDSRDNVTKNDLLEYLKTKEHGNISIEEIEPNIEDCFMDLMSK